MKKRLGMAAAGAVLAVGLVGGAGFANTGPSGSNGRDGRSAPQTNTTSNDPTAAINGIRCANLQLQIVQTQLQIASAKNPRQARALSKKVVRLQQQFLRECTGA